MCAEHCVLHGWGGVGKSISNIIKSRKNPLMILASKKLPWWLTNGEFHLVIPSTFVCWNCIVRSNFPLLFIYCSDSWILILSVYYHLFLCSVGGALQAGSCGLLTCLHHSGSLPYFLVKQAVRGLSCSFLGQFLLENGIWKTRYNISCAHCY